MTQARLFIAIPIPSHIKIVLQKALSSYSSYIQQPIPQHNWHVTLVFIGTMSDDQKFIDRLTQPLAQTFLPTISLTHMGAGLVPTQLWVYVNPTTFLENLKTIFLERLQHLGISLPEKQLQKGFVPHINLAQLDRHGNEEVGVADYPITKTFIAHNAHIYSSALASSGARYTIEGTISLSPLEHDDITDHSR